jgi:hypothetical protein
VRPRAETLAESEALATRQPVRVMNAGVYSSQHVRSILRPRTDAALRSGWSTARCDSSGSYSTREQHA